MLSRIRAVRFRNSEFRENKVGPMRNILCVTLIMMSMVTWRVHAETNPSTQPVQGLRENTPRVFALVGGKIVDRPGHVWNDATLVIRDGLVEAVGENIQAPPEATVYDITGKTVYPGLIDAYAEAAPPSDGVATALREQGAPYWNSLIIPQYSVAQYYRPSASQDEKLRSQGIVARLVAPGSGILRGTSALVSTGAASSERAILNPDVFLHGELTAPRRGRRQYPNSPMGAVALVRQAFYDAQWYEQTWQAYDNDSRLPLPERNDALQALQSLRGEATPLVLSASNELQFLRADRFAREFGLPLILVGSGHEYRRLDAIAGTQRHVIVPLDFPQAPNVGTPEAAANVTLERLMHWDLAPENPKKLVEAGVSIAFTSYGLKSPGDFLQKIREAVQRGLDKDAALRALTETPAEMAGVSRRLGSLAPGKLASFLVTDGGLFEKETKVLETWVQGERYLHNRTPEADISGAWKWNFTVGAPEPASLKIDIRGSAPDLKGELQFAEKKLPLTKLRLDGLRIAGMFRGELLKKPGVARFTAVIEQAEESTLTLNGSGEWGDGTTFRFTATQEGQTDEAASEEEAEEKEDEAKLEDRAASFAVNYPLGAYGREAPPERSALVAFEHATVWALDGTGKYEDATVLVRDGKIVAVGKDVQIPDGATVIDANGKHITPGIIDCHSHIATDGGVNESGQAITAEVRIGDFIDCNDIHIYRQLAGGVTSSNILHGSANPIGGQNQVIKMRWGSLSEEMKFGKAPAGIKFALGENVKQSNWGDNFTSRYPQSRMGVEQIIDDAFHAAADYRKRWDEWETRHEGLPPRRDLELDALVEILKGERLIHCHSYRQDEILALLRTLESHDVRIATLQHILEGYKVAEVLAQHGAMGSAFSDWWAYKFEVYDAIPYNGALMYRSGVVVSFNSDDAELARRLNLEAAKAVKYGNVPEVEALKFVTLNPAKQLRIDEHVGSLEPGKDADLVVWSGHPLSTASRCEQTWIDGRKYFDVAQSKQAEAKAREMHRTLVQKILDLEVPMQESPAEEEEDPMRLWPRVDVYCAFSQAGQP